MDWLCCLCCKCIFGGWCVLTLWQVMVSPPIRGRVTSSPANHKPRDKTSSDPPCPSCLHSSQSRQTELPGKREKKYYSVTKKKNQEKNMSHGRRRHQQEGDFGIPGLGDRNYRPGLLPTCFLIDLVLFWWKCLAWPVILSWWRLLYFTGTQ